MNAARTTRTSSYNGVTTYDARKAYEVRAEVASEILATLTSYLAGEDGGVEASHAVDPDQIHWGHVGSAREACNLLASAARHLLGDASACMLLGLDLDEDHQLDARISAADAAAGVRGTRAKD